MNWKTEEISERNQRIKEEFAQKKAKKKKLDHINDNRQKKKKTIGLRWKKLSLKNKKKALKMIMLMN